MFRISGLFLASLVGWTNFVDSNPITQAIIGPILDLVAIVPKIGTISTQQDISVLGVLDQNGTEDGWYSYIEVTPTNRYNVEFEFQLPAGINANSYNGFRLATNTRGPDMAWSPRFFEIFNLVTNTWDALGTNEGCQSWVWCYKELATNVVSNFINPSTKRALIRLQSSTQNPDAVLLDYLTLNLLTSTASNTIPPTVGPTPSPVRVVTPSPTKSPTRAPTAFPTMSPTVRPTPAPVRAVTPSPTKSPTRAPTASPTKSPTVRPTPSPVRVVTPSPTKSPTRAPTASPTKSPTVRPTTPSPVRVVTPSPTKSPTRAPAITTPVPTTSRPTPAPTGPATRLPTNQPTTSTTKTWWQPKASDMLTWQWQLQGVIDTSLNVKMYDIDLFDTSVATISQLKGQGKIVVCYFSAGSYEGWRPDWQQYFPFITGSSYDGNEPPFAGKMSGWDERWLDVRYLELLRPIMRGRIALAVSKGCDAVEPDNVDAWTNGDETLVPITAQDQLAYNRMLAEEAHAQGISIGLKNDVSQIPELVDYFDWALNEQCYQYNECGNYDIFVNKNKAVFGVEYSGNPAVFCPKAKASKFSWLKKELSLQVWRQGCENY